MLTLLQYLINSPRTHYVLVSEPYKWYQPDFAGIATLLAVLVALFSERFWRWLEKPKLAPKEIVSTPQTHQGQTHTYQRLIVRNVGRRVAKEVRVFLTYMTVPQGFIPIPLNWTHWNRSTRDVSAGEEAYIDLLVKTNGGLNRFCWSHEAGTPSEPLLVNFNSESGNLRIECFEQDRKVCDVELKFVNGLLQIVPNSSLN